MLGTYYYHEIVRKTIISFGTVFNNIVIKHKSQDGEDFSDFKVPLSYTFIASRIKLRCSGWS